METDMNMDSDGTINMDFAEQLIQPQQQPQSQQLPRITVSTPDIPSLDSLSLQPQGAGMLPAPPATTTQSTETPAPPPAREAFRDIPVKVHIRRPDRDSWAYLGRAVVTQETIGRAPRIIVKSLSSHKILTSFGEGSALQAEKRGNFVVIGCIEGTRVVSWSLNALNNADTLRLLATIELFCYSCKPTSESHSHNTYRRRIARMIKDDRRKRHKRRKDQDAMVAAFAKTGLDDQAMQP